MKRLVTNQKIRSSGLLVFAIMFANLMNFLFNAYLGRALDFESFGVLTLITSLWYLISIPLNSLAGTTNYMIAFATARSGKKSGDSFFKHLKGNLFLFATISAVIWLILSPLIASFFQVSSIAAVAILSIVIIYGTLAYINRAYLQGNFLFQLVALTIVIESLVKFTAAVFFNMAGYGSLAYISIPISLFIAFLLTKILVAPKIKATPKATKYSFPKKFFGVSLLSVLASTAFLTFDVILAKHFLSPYDAGVYALLSLVGKMVYFVGSLLNGISATYISREAGKSIKNQQLFYKFLALSAIASFGTYIILGPFGHLVTPALFGTKAASIFPYLSIYSLAMALYTLTSLFVSYHLIYKQYIFAYISVAMASALGTGILAFHQDILQISYVVLAISIFNFFTILASHWLVRNKPYEI